MLRNVTEDEVSVADVSLGFYCKVDVVVDGVDARRGGVKLLVMYYFSDGGDDRWGRM